MSWIYRAVFAVILLHTCFCDGRGVTSSCESATCERERELKRWLDVVFFGMTSLPKIGSPGRIFTFGEHSHAAVIGGDNDDVIMALGTLGKGKVAAFGHPQYIRHLNVHTMAEQLSVDPRNLFPQYNSEDDDDLDDDFGGRQRGQGRRRGGGRRRGRGRDGERGRRRRERRGAARKERRQERKEENKKRFKGKKKGKNRNNGEAVAFDAFLGDESLKQLHMNLLTWLKEDKLDTGISVCIGTGAELVSHCLNADPGHKSMVVVWLGEGSTTPEEDALMTEWVKGGGALLHGFSAAENSDMFNVMEVGFYSTLLEAGIAYDPTPAELEDQIQVSSHTNAVTRLNSMNLLEMPEQLVLNFMDIYNNDRLHHLISVVRYEQHYFPVEVSSKLLKPLESFAVNQEPGMTWPQGNLTHPKNFIACPPELLTMLHLYYTLGLAELWKEKAPGVELFPGDISPPPVTTSAYLSFQSLVTAEDYPTGYYLPAGQAMTITFLNDHDDDTWTEFEILIGSYTDNLNNREVIARWPVIMRSVIPTSRKMTLRWMFGGLLTVRAPEGEGKTLKMNITGVVHTPTFDLTRPETVGAWARSCATPGLTADVRGVHFRFTLPPQDVCKLSSEYLADNLRNWDRIVEKSWELNGRPVHRQRNQWITLDIQTGGGLMHSGFPIVGNIGKAFMEDEGFLFNNQWETHWGPYHELGHNLNNMAWRWDEVIEVNPNIYALLHIERLTKYHDLTIPKLQHTLETTRKAGLKEWLKNPTYEDMRNNNKVGLLVFAQLVRDFRWGCLKEVMHSYQTSGFPSDNVAKINEWVRRWGEKVQVNLAPLFDFWQWPLEAATYAAMRQYPIQYLPDDVITQDRAAEPLVRDILAKYPGVQRSIIKPACAYSYIMD